VLVLVSTVAAAASAVYGTGSTGYDVSYPQCGTAVSGAFGIVGVNGGRPFSANGCFLGEYAAATNATVYVNTGYAKTYGRHVFADCQARSASYPGAAAVEQAYAIGCSEGEYSQAAVQGVAPPVWWLDVETANSWSTSNLALNRAAIQGLVDYLDGLGATVGVYSTGYQWGQIAGAGWVPTGVAATWIAGAPSAAAAPGYCAQPFLPGVPVWLVQYTTTYDLDYAC
jgi:hypothetical protein